MKVISTERIPIKLWLEDIDKGALQQAKNLANLPFAFRHIAIMPDSHVGYGMPIGGVLATEGTIIPNAVGVDIGCGMIAVQTSLSEINVEYIKRILGLARGEIPVGFNHQEEEQKWDGFEQAPDIAIIQKELSSARRQLGTLGGGNHFIEIQNGSDGHIWLMIHSGSRNLGKKTADVYHKLALSRCEKWHSKLPDPELAFFPFDSTEGIEYFRAMRFCLDFAKANRALMMERLLRILDFVSSGQLERSINIHHNYAAMENHFGKNVIVHRKGATLARAGMDCIIPGSMGTSSYICRGLGNPESFQSCSHGAGRKMGRREATEKLNLAEEQSKMSGIVHGLRNVQDLEEAPGAYKAIETVMANQADLVEIEIKLTPLAVIKA